MIEFLASNWLWIAAIALFVLMHRGGHGCGMHGGHHRRQYHQPAHHAGDDVPAQRPETFNEEWRAEHGAPPTSRGRRELA